MWRQEAGIHTTERSILERKGRHLSWKRPPQLPAQLIQGVGEMTGCQEGELSVGDSGHRELITKRMGKVP